MPRANTDTTIRLIASYPATPLETRECIDGAHTRPNISPISEYNQEASELRRYVRQQNEFDPRLFNYILLGHVSLAEGYFRSVIRKAILIDKYALSAVAEQKVTFAAAQHLAKDMIPESLLEGVSFTSSKNLTDSFKSYLGLTGHHNEIAASLENYERICQLRHCIVHRFSYLGSANAAKLGIDDHSQLIEKPIVFDYARAQAALQVIDVAVRLVNNFLFTSLVYRVRDKSGWQWVYKRDKALFSKYYRTFIDPNEAGSLEIRAAYNQLLATKQPQRLNN